MADEATVDSVVEGKVQDAFTRALTNFKGTVSYEKKVNDGNYGSDQWQVFVQFDWAPDADAEEFLAQAREATNLAALVVFERLNLDFYKDDSGVIRQVLQEFPGATVEPATGGATASTPAAPPFTEEQIKALTKGTDEYKDAQRANREWGEARKAAAPSEFFDNRATKTGNQPDYRHKKFGHVALWD